MIKDRQNVQLFCKDFFDLYSLQQKYMHTRVTVFQLIVSVHTWCMWLYSAAKHVIWQDTQHLPVSACVMYPH